ncbi:hypothetical protein BJ508DRAFT_417020 [Ascobolus immersus RN42]|uniref:Uncharacterized protein n=1 Tax=Ascobolus immersus RN42 TaxID=1160509 RepID=A0A3N4HUT3_ASCIM|nr:hypothetical protein BJ508DRAFT_417020 [Ascobolus immersus RN42]
MFTATQLTQADTTSISYLHGFSRPLLTESTLISQLTLSIIYLVVLVLTLALTFTPYPPSTRISWILYLRAALTLFSLSFLLLSIRTGLLLKSWSQHVPVPPSFPLEQSFTTDIFPPLALLLTVGITIHLVNTQRRAVNKFLGRSRSFLGGLQGYFIKFLFLATLALTITHFSFSLHLARNAIKTNNTTRASTDPDAPLPILGDKDFSLLLTTPLIQSLNARAGAGVNLDWLKARFIPTTPTPWVSHRDNMIRVGIARDWLLAFLVLFEGALAAWVWFRKASKISARGSEEFISSLTWLLLVIIPGLLWTVLFNAIVSTHYGLHNWKVLNSTWEWWGYFTRYIAASQAATSDASGVFLEGYRRTPEGFQIIQAVLQPLGVVLALGAVTYLARRELRVRREEEKLGGLGALEGSYDVELPQIRGVSQLDLGEVGQGGERQGGRGMMSIDLRD